MAAEPKANPLVEEPDDEELAALEAAGAEPAAEPAPIAESITPPTERRSRREGKKPPSAEPTEADLTKSEAFRRWQAEADKRYEAERQRAAALERQMQEQQEAERRNRLAYLESQMDNDELDAPVRRQARQEYVAVASQAYAHQLQQWEQFKRNEITQRGFDASDPRFARVYSPGQAGLAEFQADLHAAEAAQLRKDLAEAKKAIATPETIADLVKKELARQRAAAGLDTVDLGEPDGALDEDEWARDFALVNKGKMSKQKFLDKYRDK